MGGYVAGPPVMAALLRAHAGGRDGAERRSRASPIACIGRFVTRALVIFPETARVLSARAARR